MRIYASGTRVIAAVIACVTALACTDDAQVAGPAPSLSADAAPPEARRRIESLADAAQLDLSLGDFDGDGVAELALSARAGTRSSSHADAGTATQALTSPLADAVVLTHDAGGNLVVAPTNADFDFASAEPVASLSRTEFGAEIDGLLEDLVNDSCTIASRLIELAAAAVKGGVLAESDGGSWQDVMLAVIGAPRRTPLPAAPADQDDDFVSCLRTPQTPMGCFAIQALFVLEGLCDGNATGLCDLVKRRAHCYQVGANRGSKCPDSRARSTLCDKADASGCCNAAFVYDTIFRSDLRNMAPLPSDPSTGPILDSQTVILDGPRAPAELLSLASLVLGKATGTLLCGLDALAKTRNPITLSVSPGQRCGRNTALLGHVLQGRVDQCVAEDSKEVYSTITGSSDGTARVAGLNEQVGPLVLSTVRDHFQEQVSRVLREISEQHLCCEGGRLLGATTRTDSDGLLHVEGSSGARPQCSAAASDAGVSGNADAGAKAGAKDAGTVPPGTSTTDAAPGSDGGRTEPTLSCRNSTRFSYSGSGAWDDKIYDNQTGLVWHRNDEISGDLEPCIDQYASYDAPYCCRSPIFGPIVQDPPLYKAYCNWTGARKHCEDRSMRLATRDELLSIAGPTNYPPDCVTSWETWALDGSAPGRAWFVHDNEIVQDLEISGSLYGTFGVRCVFPDKTPTARGGSL